jgi:hypothetical protein
VRVGLLHRVLISALPVASVFLIYAGAQELQASRQIGTHWSFLDPVYFELLTPVILIVINGITFWRVRRDKTLLRDGALTAAVVTHQKPMAAAGGRGGGRKHSRIRYRFKDASGQMFQGTGADDSLL